MNHLSILHTTPGVGKHSQGVGQVAINLANCQRQLGASVNIWCRDEKEEIEWAAQRTGFPEENIKSFGTSRLRQLISGPEMIWAAKRHGKSIDIVHQHGLWTSKSFVSKFLRSVYNVAVVVAPHGSLEKWALSKSICKKQLALRFYERDNLYRADCLHATALSEVASFRDFGLKTPIALIPNGISRNLSRVEGNGNRFREMNRIPLEKRVLFFLSRISPKKGLPMLLRALAHLKQNQRNWILVIAGNDEFNHKKEVSTLAYELGLNESIRFLGPLYDQEKSAAFEAADVFVLPSHSEGAPIAVLEALDAAVPVITTKASHWEDLNTYKCGWWSEISRQGLIDALTKALELAPEELLQMGERGQKLVNNFYSWTELAKKSLLLYRWLLGKDDQPDFVMTD